VTLDDTTLARALHDLAGTVPDDPGRLAHVHHLARRRHRRQRAIGAGALAATMAAAVVGAEAIASTGGRPSAGIHPASGGPAPTPAPGAATVAPSSGARVATLPTCAPAPAPQPNNKATGDARTPPAIGQETAGGGVISTPGTATSVRITVQGGPLAGSDVTLTIGPSSLVDVDGQVTTGDHLLKGLDAKFTATRTGATTYLADEIHAGTESSAAGTKQGAPAVVAPPAIGGNFKVAGAVTAVSATTLTVDVQGGSLPPGPTTFTLQCTAAGVGVGKMVGVAGTRTGASTYTASFVGVQGP
jgi:hypothetical protein